MCQVEFEPRLVTPADGNSTLDQLIDIDYHNECEADTSPEVTLVEIRAGLSSIKGSMAADISADRDEH